MKWCGNVCQNYEPLSLGGYVGIIYQFYLTAPPRRTTSLPLSRRLVDRSRYFAMGEISQRCYDGLRESGEQGVSPDEIAVKAMADKGLDAVDQAMRPDFMRRFHWALARIQRDARAEKIGAGKRVRWRLMPEPSGAQ